MHSRIMGISTKTWYDEEVAKRGKEDVKLPYYLYEEDLPYNADYVDKDTSLEEDFDWLCNYLDNDYFEYNKENHIIKFLPGYKDEFLGKKFKKLKNLVNAEDAFEKFSSWTGIYEFQDIVNEHGGFIIADIDGIYQKLDDFIRAMDENKEYVVFDSLDYHF